MDGKLKRTWSWLDKYLAALMIVIGGIAISSLILVIDERNARISSIQDTSCRYYETTSALKPKDIPTPTNTADKITDNIQAFVEAAQVAAREQGCPAK